MKTIREKFLYACKNADVIKVDDSPLLSSWGYYGDGSEFDNMALAVKWHDDVGLEYEVQFDMEMLKEDTIIINSDGEVATPVLHNGLCRFTVMDTDGEMSEIEFFSLYPLDTGKF